MSNNKIPLSLNDIDSFLEEWSDVLEQHASAEQESVSKEVQYTLRVLRVNEMPFVQKPDGTIDAVIKGHRLINVRAYPPSDLHPSNVFGAVFEYDKVEEV